MYRVGLYTELFYANICTCFLLIYYPYILLYFKSCNNNNLLYGTYISATQITKHIAYMLQKMFP